MQVYAYTLTPNEHRSIIAAYPTSPRCGRRIEFIADSQEDADAFLLGHLQMRFPKASITALDGSCVTL